MTDEPPPRRTLSLKSAVTLKPVTEAPDPKGAKTFKPARAFKAAPPPPPPAEPAHGWKCKPCGKGFDPPEGAPDEDTVRCPNCNARLGLVGDFKQDPPPNRLRARPVKRV